MCRSCCPHIGVFRQMPHCHRSQVQQSDRFKRAWFTKGVFDCACLPFSRHCCWPSTHRSWCQQNHRQHGHARRRFLAKTRVPCRKATRLLCAGDCQRRNAIAFPNNSAKSRARTADRVRLGRQRSGRLTMRNALPCRAVALLWGLAGKAAARRQCCGNGFSNVRRCNRVAPCLNQGGLYCH